MRYTITALLVCISLMASGQDIKFMLSGANKKKWIGANVYNDGREINNVNLTFFSNFSCEEYSVKYKKPSVPQKWKIINGEYREDSVVIQIGNRLYNVEFSKTSNGRDFMTLNRIPIREEEPVLTKTYYSE